MQQSRMTNAVFLGPAIKTFLTISNVTQRETSKKKVLEIDGGGELKRVNLLILNYIWWLLLEKVHTLNTFIYFGYCFI